MTGREMFRCRDTWSDIDIYKLCYLCGYEWRRTSVCVYMGSVYECEGVEVREVSMWRSV